MLCTCCCLQAALDTLSSHGTNLLRVWLHIDGAINPAFGRQNPAAKAASCSSITTASNSSSAASACNVEDGQMQDGEVLDKVVGCGDGVIEDLKWLLKEAHAHDIRVLLVLWSHDVLAVRR